MPKKEKQVKERQKKITFRGKRGKKEDQTLREISGDNLEYHH